MSNSYKFYSDTKDIMKKYVNATEGAIIYGISKSRIMVLASEAGAVYKVGNSALINTDIFEMYLEKFKEPTRPLPKHIWNKLSGEDKKDRKDEWYRQLFERLDNSKFRSSFHLKQKDIDYINEKGLETIRQHAKDFITKREAPAYIANDGKQTPMRGHPVFIAQHATATCCRECIRKWHKMQPGKELSQVQQDYLVDVIMTWIQKEIERQEHKI